MRHGPVRLLWISRVSSMIAFQMNGVAAGWQMYELTSNPLDLGLIGLSQFVPAAMLALVAGQVMDRCDRSPRAAPRPAGRGGRLRHPPRHDHRRHHLAGMDFAVAFIIGSARAFEGTAFQTVLPVIVERKHLTRARAALASAQQTATIGGPALGGFLYLLLARPSSMRSARACFLAPACAHCSSAPEAP